MKLIRASIENFGKLQNQQIIFQDGCNLFHHENGWGKSTLAAFLKVMLYGFENERSRDEYTNERKRYRPWQGGIYGGSLTFEANGKVYTVIRSFGLKEKEDEFFLREEETNLESSDYSTGLGEELFHLDRDSFEKTIFLAQNHCDTKTTDKIHAKLGNLADATDDVNHYEQADARLNDLLNAMSPVRKTGSLYRMKEQIAELKQEMRKSENLEKETERLLLEKIALEKEYRSLKKQQEKLLDAQRKASALKDVEAKRERYHLLSEQLWKREQEMENAGRFFTEEIPIREELDVMINQSLLLTAWEQQKNTYSLTDQEQKPLRQRKEQKIEGAFLLASGGAAALVIGAVLLYCGYFMGIFLLGAGAIAAVFGVIQSQKRSISKEYESMMQEKAGISYQQGKAVIEEYLTRLGFQPEANLQRQLLSLKSKLDEYDISITEVEKAQKEMELFASANNMELIRQADSNLGKNLLEEIQEQLAEIQLDMESCHQKMVQKERQVEENHRIKESYAEIETNLTFLQEKYLDDSVKYERLKMTRDYLAKAKASFTAKYRHPLMKSFSKYYEMISGERTDIIRMNSNMELSVQEYGNQRESRYYSAGWKDLMGICMRLALVDAMFTKEKPFLIFDDPFVNLDQKKTKASLEFLKEIGKEYQVLYFTCHESRIP